jgi:hypothetical protein
MSIYTIVLFVHVSGAIGYFIGMGIYQLDRNPVFTLPSLGEAFFASQIEPIEQECLCPRNGCWR